MVEVIFSFSLPAFVSSQLSDIMARVANFINKFLDMSWLVTPVCTTLALTWESPLGLRPELEVLEKLSAPRRSHAFHS